MAKFLQYNQALALIVGGTIDFANDAFTLALTTAAPVNGNTDVAQLTQIAYTNLTGDLTLATTAYNDGADGNPVKWTVADKSLTAAGGAIGPFRYVHIYHQTTGDLLFHYDMEDDLTIVADMTLNLDFSQAEGVFRIRFVPA